MGSGLMASSGTKIIKPFWNPRHHPVTTHDESGQVFTEVSCKGASMRADWKWKTRGSPREYGLHTHPGPGSPSLYDMAVRSCLLNSGDITAETLKEVPGEIGLKLWDRIVTAQLDSVQVFLAFAERYRSAIGRKFHVISEPSLPLFTYVADVTSRNYEWLTHLTLSHITVPRTALIQLSLVTNLAVLVVGPDALAPDIGVDDNLVRTWSRSASMGAFRVLRVLVLLSQEHVTPRIFENLYSFPSLATFATNVFGTTLGDRALTLGWKHQSKNCLKDWRGDTRLIDSRWHDSLQNIFDLSGPVDTERSSIEKIESLESLSNLHLAIGGYPSRALLSEIWETTLRIWRRLSQTNDADLASKAELTISKHSIGTGGKQLPTPSTSSRVVLIRKRARESKDGSKTRKTARPALRASKGQDIAAILSDLVS